jgi:hypothetical protein
MPTHLDEWLLIGFAAAIAIITVVEAWVRSRGKKASR